MKNKARLCLVIILLFSLLITSGCSVPLFKSYETLMHPPKATGDKEEIQNVIDRCAGTDYVLKYPLNGTNRSSITMYDLDNDETDEAVALLTLHPNTDEAETHIYIIDKVKGQWDIIGDFKKQNNDIDCIEFGDVNGDSLTDILVGWNTYSINQKELYCYIFGKDIKEINTKERYTNMAVDNFTDDNKSTIITVSLSSADNLAVGKLISLNDKNVVTSYETDMDSDITKFTAVKSGMVNSDRIGLFVDGLNSSNTYNTQVLYFDTVEYRLVNPVYSNSYKGVLSTERKTSTVCQDIDNDGRPEIPVTKALPCPKGENTENYAYQTDWSVLDTESGTLNVTSSVIINDNYKYTIYIPDEWIGGYTAFYNGDSSVLTFCQATPLKNSARCVKGGTIVAYISTLNKDWINIGLRQGYTKLLDAGIYSYGYHINKKTPYIFTKEQAKEIFVLKEEEEAVAIVPTEAGK